MRGAARKNALQIFDGGGAISGMDNLTRESALFDRPSEKKGIVLRVLDQKYKWA